MRPWQLIRQPSYSGVIVWTVRPEERQRRCEVCVVVRRWRCSAHTGSELCEWCGRTAMCCILALCGFCGIVCGLPVVSQHLVENWGP